MPIATVNKDHCFGKLLFSRKNINTFLVMSSVENVFENTMFFFCSPAYPFPSLKINIVTRNLQPDVILII